MTEDRFGESALQIAAMTEIRVKALLLVGRPMSAGLQRGAAKIPVVLLNVRSTWRKSAGRLMRVTLDWVRSANGFHAEPRGARTRG